MATGLLDRRPTRRSVLQRMAVGASALAVAPVRFLTRPGTAAQAINCADCHSGDKCCDGWTVFCCSLTGVNACPPYTYIGGWWKCTSYTGTGMCAAEGVRYYMDCNTLPGSTCQGGCRCALEQCDHRRACCNVFRYGQCNTQIGGVQAIACRVIKCVNPCTIYSECTCTLKVDDATCSHEEAEFCQ
jgi:hypothetical protein